PSPLQNLVAFDLILCRNAMIYFSRSTNERLSQHFHQTLVDGGWLMVGYAESDRDLFRMFEPTTLFGATLFKKSASETPLYMPLVLADFIRRVVPSPAKPTPHEITLRDLLDRGQWDEALLRCEQEHRANTLDPTLHYYEALVHEQMGHWEQAE